MNIRTHISDQVLPVLEAAVNNGFRAFVTKPGDSRTRANFAYVCLNTEGSFAIINGGHNRLETATLAAPIKPHRDYGSSVLVDYDETPEGAVEALRGVCCFDGVVVRFMKDGSAPVVLNHGSRVFDGFPGGREGFVEVTAEDLADPANTATNTASGVSTDQEKELTHV